MNRPQPSRSRPATREQAPNKRGGRGQCAARAAYGRGGPGGSIPPGLGLERRSELTLSAHGGRPRSAGFPELVSTRAPWARRATPVIHSASPAPAPLRACSLLRGQGHGQLVWARIHGSRGAFATRQREKIRVAGPAPSAVFPHAPRRLAGRGADSSSARRAPRCTSRAQPRPLRSAAAEQPQ
jgi:hypothetical protein